MLKARFITLPKACYYSVLSASYTSPSPPPIHHSTSTNTNTTTDSPWVWSCRVSSSDSHSSLRAVHALLVFSIDFSRSRVFVVRVGWREEKKKACVKRAGKKRKNSKKKNQLLSLDSTILFLFIFDCYYYLLLLLSPLLLLNNYPPWNLNPPPNLPITHQTRHMQRPIYDVPTRWHREGGRGGTSSRRTWNLPEKRKRTRRRKTKRTIMRD